MRLAPRTLGYLGFSCDGGCGKLVNVLHQPGRWTSDDRVVESIGWTPILTPGGWEHYCPDCAPKATA